MYLSINAEINKSQSHQRTKNYESEQISLQLHIITTKDYTLSDAIIYYLWCISMLLSKEILY